PSAGPPLGVTDAALFVEETIAFAPGDQLLLYTDGLIEVFGVSGEMYGQRYFPHVAGVGFSFNPFAWREDIDPHAGVLRLVFGLGTRAVDRTGDDYARLVALNAPLKRPEAKPEDARRYSQRHVDVLDLQANQFTTCDFETAAKAMPRQTRKFFEPVGDEPAAETLSLDRLLSETSFPDDMRRLLQTLQEAYAYPVDIEFTANFLSHNRYRINLLQCRPFQVRMGVEGQRVKFPERMDAKQLVFESRGPVVGQSLATAINRLIYVVPSVYSRLSMGKRYSVARLIGRLTHLSGARQAETIMLLGPGRWGTSMPALGVPVQFTEINTVSVMCELALMHEGLVPDISLGTHFFNDLVEMDMLYLAVMPGREGHSFNEKLLMKEPNRLTALFPSAAEYEDVIRVIDAGPRRSGFRLYLNADSMKQRAVCYKEESG
ncbi:MAG: SpoIIE family protein phosphatase, partial [Verrucomicrobiae bacterium]|nr:SpoIIE family protein phosphatase [Verrucomicrobiae bacterium]